VNPSLVATSLPAPLDRTNSGGRSPLAGWPVCPGACKRSPADAKSADWPPLDATELASHLPTAWMSSPWKPGVRMPAATVSTVTVAYPLVKSMVASATCLPSAVFICVVSF
jgi:hypothetical protein